jgi:peptide methionine sulfoxide reductase msrA/msrB
LDGGLLIPDVYPTKPCAEHVEVSYENCIYHHHRSGCTLFCQPPGQRHEWKNGKTESDFEKVDGVIEAISGYTGGHVANPTYKQVSKGVTGHVEAVEVVYDPAKLTYEKLLEVFWRHVDPTDGDGQFVDRGSQYRSVIFYANEKEHRSAEASKKTLAASGRFDKPIATDILPLSTFYPAEDYHQDYYRHEVRYEAASQD